MASITLLDLKYESSSFRVRLDQFSQLGEEVSWFGGVKTRFFMLGYSWEFSVFNESNSLETLNTQLLAEEKEEVPWSYQVTFIGQVKSYGVTATNEAVAVKHSVLHGLSIITDDSILMIVQVERRFCPRTFVAAIACPLMENVGEMIKVDSFDLPSSVLNSRLFNSSEFSDVTLVVQNKQIPAHKFILSTNSPVFQQMLSGNWIEVNGSITIPDSEATAMYSLLRYIYCRELLIDPEHIFNTLYLLNKYLDETEMKNILTVCGPLVTPENVVQFYAFCITFSDEPIGEILKHCTKIFNKSASDPIKVIGKFTKCPYETILHLLSSDSINFNEFDLFNVSIEWAVEECKRRTIEATTENLRSLLLPHIRFTLMTPHELLNGPSRVGFLSDDEIMRILKYQHCDVKSFDFPFETRSRSSSGFSSKSGPSKSKIVKLDC